jgi:thiamine transporter
MVPFLFQFISRADDGSYVLEKGGYVVFGIAIFLLICIAAAIMSSKDKGDSRRAVRLTVSAISIALAFITSYIQLFKLPWGGSVTLFSMFFVCFVGYLYGPSTGLTAAFAFGILQFLQSGGSYILSIPQVLFDYILAFAALGIAGFFYKAKNGLIIGYIAGCIGRGVFASIAGYLYWMDYMPESFPKKLAFLYPIAYNYSYILIEMALTLVLLAIPSVRKSIKRIAFEATKKD